MTEPVVQGCDPREHASGIEELFTRNGQPGFETVFERTYRRRAEETGLRSWIGTVGDRIVMHVSVSPVRFSDGKGTVVGGICGDLMVDERHRDFWSPLRLLRTMVADLKRDGGPDFLISSATDNAETVFKAAGFKVFGRLGRYVLPTFRPYLTIQGVRLGGVHERGRLLGTIPFSSDQRLSEDMWRPVPSSEFYQTRVGRLGFEVLDWVEFRSDGGSRVAMCNVGRSREVEIADALWSSPGALPRIALGAAHIARVAGASKLIVSTLSESRIASELRRCGFLLRGVRSTMLVCKLRELPRVENVFLTGFALNSW